VVAGVAGERHAGVDRDVQDVAASLDGRPCSDGGVGADGDEVADDCAVVDRDVVAHDVDEVADGHALADGDVAPEDPDTLTDGEICAVLDVVADVARHGDDGHGLDQGGQGHVQSRTFRYP